MLKNKKTHILSAVIIMIVCICIYYNPLTQFLLSYKEFKEKEKLLYDPLFYESIASVLVKCCTIPQSNIVVKLEKSVFPKEIDMLYQFKYADASHQAAHLHTGGGAVKLGYLLVSKKSDKQKKDEYGWTLYAWTSNKKTNNKPICDILLMKECEISYKTNATGHIIEMSDSVGIKNIKPQSNILFKELSGVEPKYSSQDVNNK